MFPTDVNAKKAKNNMRELEHFVVSSIKFVDASMRPQVEIDIKAKKQIISAFYKEHNIDENYMKTGRTKEEEMNHAREQSANLDW